MFSLIYTLKVNLFFQNDGEILVWKTWRKGRQAVWCFSSWLLIINSYLSLNFSLPLCISLWATIDFGIQSEIGNCINTATSGIKYNLYMMATPKSQSSSYKFPSALQTSLSEGLRLSTLCTELSSLLCTVQVVSCTFPQEQTSHEEDTMPQPSLAYKAWRIVPTEQSLVDWRIVVLTAWVSKCGRKGLMRAVRVCSSQCYLSGPESTPDQWGPGHASAQQWKAVWQVTKSTCFSSCVFAFWPCQLEFI